MTRFFCLDIVFHLEPSVSELTDLRNAYLFLRWRVGRRGDNGQFKSLPIPSPLYETAKTDADAVTSSMPDSKSHAAADEEKYIIGVKGGSTYVPCNLLPQ